MAQTNRQQSPLEDYDGYRTSSRHELIYEQANLSAPAPQFTSSNPYPYSSYPRTEDVQPAYRDYQSPYYNNPTTSNLELNGNFQPLHPSQLYQDNVKPADSETATPPPIPPKERTLMSKLFDGEQRFAYFCWIISIIQIGVFIGELVKNTIATHIPIEVQPVFNPLIGPSSYVLSISA